MFTQIPGFSLYSIDVHGNVLHQGQIHTGYVSEQGYRMIQVVSDTGQRRIVGIHRLLALAYIPCPGDPETMIPNHRDGNKQNNELSNLEWTTYSGNITHAYATGLRTDNRRVAVMNAATREVATFNSLGECGRFFDVHPAAIHWQLNFKKEFRPYKGHFVKYESDARPWPSQDTIFGKTCRDGTKIKMTDATMGTIAYVDSMEEAGRRLGCSAASILYRLRKVHASPYRGHYLEYA